jgi:hypothetical protein
MDEFELKRKGPACRSNGTRKRGRHGEPRLDQPHAAYDRRRDRLDEVERISI